MGQIQASLLAAALWIWENPATALVAVVTFLTALVAGYYRLEPRIKAYVKGTTETWDDEALDRIDVFFRQLDVVLGVVRLFLPAIVARARRSSVPSPTRDTARPDDDSTPRGP